MGPSYQRNGEDFRKNIEWFYIILTIFWKTTFKIINVVTDDKESHVVTMPFLKPLCEFAH